MDEGLEKYKNNILVTIVIPVYNVSDYIIRCLDSVANQTYKHIECILVDDCGTDDSIEKASDYISKYKGEIVFKLVHHELNKGLSAARNTGINNSQGSYLYFLDSDDELAPNCIKYLISPVFADDSIEIVQGNIYVPNSSTTYYNISNFNLNAEYLDNISISKIFYDYHRPFPINAWNKLIKHQFLVDNNLFFKEGIIHEDQQWIFFVIRKLNHIYFVFEFTYLHYITENSIMTSLSKQKSKDNYTIILQTYLEDTTRRNPKLELHYIFCFFTHLYTLCGKSVIYDAIYTKLKGEVAKQSNFSYSFFLRLCHHMPNWNIFSKVINKIVRLFNRAIFI